MFSEQLHTNLSKQEKEKLINILENIKIEKDLPLEQRTIEDKDINEIISFIKDRKYGLYFEKHIEQVDIDCEKNFLGFVEDVDKKIEVDKSLPYNFLLEGDNLHSLKLLEKTHIKNGKGLIDVIYIDPPYNTGNKDFKYNDKIVDSEDGYKHSKWLSFMKARLEIAYNLLSDDGVIFISIDEHEYSNLTTLLKNLYDDNNVETIIWNKISEGGTAGNGKMKITKRFRNDHEYIIVLYKNKNNTFFKKPLKIPQWKTQYPNKDNDPRGPWCDGELCKSETKSNPSGKNYYTITTPSGKNSYTRQWHCSEDDFKKYLNDTKITENGEIVSRIWWGTNGEKCPRLKKFQLLPLPTTPNSILKDISQTNGNNDFDLVFYGKTNKERIFDNPKPIKLIKELINMIDKDNFVVLDFFAGSGTTGHAVLELNKEDGGNRKFILCTNNENNICEDITYQRLKTVITGIRQDGSQYSEGLPANLKYFKTTLIDKNDDDLEDELLDSCIPLIELENAMEVREKTKIVFNDEELENVMNNLSNIETIYIVYDVLLTSKQKDILKKNNIEIKELPKYYFDEI